MVQVGYPSSSDAELAQTALTTAARPFDTGGARLLVDVTDAKDTAAILAAPPTS